MNYFVNNNGNAIHRLFVFYLLEVFSGVNLIYRGRVFCTDQTNFEKFTVNAGVYDQETAGDNTFVII